MTSIPPVDLTASLAMDSEIHAVPEIPVVPEHAQKLNDAILQSIPAESAREHTDRTLYWIGMIVTFALISASVGMVLLSMQTL